MSESTFFKVEHGQKVHENKHYVVVVGMPPSTPDMPVPFTGYLIVNKETGVTESWHGVLGYAKQNADLFNEILVRPQPEEQKNPWDKPEKKTDRNFN